MERLSFGSDFNSRPMTLSPCLNLGLLLHLQKGLQHPLWPAVVGVTDSKRTKVSRMVRSFLRAVSWLRKDVSPEPDRTQSQKIRSKERHVLLTAGWAMIAPWNGTSRRKMKNLPWRPGMRGRMVEVFKKAQVGALRRANARSKRGI